MTEKELLNLADRNGTRHGDLCDYDVSFEFTPKQLFIFFGAIEQRQKERDAEIANICGAIQVAKAILKG